VKNSENKLLKNGRFQVLKSGGNRNKNQAESFLKNGRETSIKSRKQFLKPFRILAEIREV